MTSTLHSAVFSPTLAVIVASPLEIPLISPLLTLTIELSLDDQITVLSSVVFIGLYITVKSSYSPTFIVVLVLFKLIDLRGLFTVKPYWAV